MILNSPSIYHFVKKNRISKSFFLGYCVIISLSLYFLSVSLFGEKSFNKLLKLQQNSSKLELQKTEMQAKLNHKKKLVSSLNAESLDLDLVDEQSRKVLGYIGKNEKVIFKNTQN